MRLPLVGDVLDPVLHFTCCKDLEIVSREQMVHQLSMKYNSLHCRHAHRCLYGMPVSLVHYPAQKLRRD